VKSKVWLASAVTMLGVFSVASGFSYAATGPNAKRSALLAPTSQPVTITYSGWGIPSQIQSYQNEVTAFEKIHPNVTIREQFLPWSGNENKLIAEEAGGQLPDVMVTSSAWFTEFAQKGAYKNLSPYFNAAHLQLKGFAPGAIVGNSINKHLYMVPNTGAYPGGGAMGGVVVLYNEAMLKKAHLNSPSPKWTLSNFVHESQLLTIDANGKNATQSGFVPQKAVQWGTNIGYGVADNIWDELLPAYGGWYWNTKKSASTIASAAGVKAAEFLKNLVSPLNASISPAASAGISDTFAAGKVAFSYFWANEAQTEATTVNFPVGVATVPAGPFGRGFFKPTLSTGVVTNGWAISAHTQHPKTAWEFLQFLATSQTALKARGLTGVEQLAYSPLIKTWLSMMSPIDKKINQVDNLQWKEAPTRAYPGWGGEYAEFWNDAATSLQKYYLNESPAFAALEQLQQQADTLLKQNQN